MFAIIQIPQHSVHVLATGRTQGTIGGNSHCVQVASVAGVVDLQLAVSQVPYLEVGKK